MSKLDDIYYDLVWTDDSDKHDHENFRKEIKSLILELIDKNEDGRNDTWQEARNYLRQELREKVEQL